MIFLKKTSEKLQSVQKLHPTTIFSPIKHRISTLAKKTFLNYFYAIFSPHSRQDKCFHDCVHVYSFMMPIYSISVAINCNYFPSRLYTLAIKSWRLSEIVDDTPWGSFSSYSLTCLGVINIFIKN